MPALAQALRRPFAFLAAAWRGLWVAARVAAELRIRGADPETAKQMGLRAALERERERIARESDG